MSTPDTRLPCLRVTGSGLPSGRVEQACREVVGIGCSRPQGITTSDGGQSGSHPAYGDGSILQPRKDPRDTNSSAIVYLEPGALLPAPFHHRPASRRNMACARYSAGIPTRRRTFLLTSPPRTAIEL
jgi:hypothetical protein